MKVIMMVLLVILTMAMVINDDGDYNSDGNTDANDLNGSVGSVNGDDGYTYSQYSTKSFR